MFNGERIMSKECIACGKKQLDKDTVGINKKLLGKDIANFYCMDCLAAKFEFQFKGMDSHTTFIQAG